jgi:hypothetical protein
LLALPKAVVGAENPAPANGEQGPFLTHAPISGLLSLVESRCTFPRLPQRGASGRSRRAMAGTPGDLAPSGQGPSRASSAQIGIRSGRVLKSGGVTDNLRSDVAGSAVGSYTSVCSNCLFRTSDTHAAGVSDRGSQDV